MQLGAGVDEFVLLVGYLFVSLQGRQRASSSASVRGAVIGSCSAPSPRAAHASERLELGEKGRHPRT